MTSVKISADRAAGLRRRAEERLRERRKHRSSADAEGGNSSGSPEGSRFPGEEARSDPSGLPEHAPFPGNRRATEKAQRLIQELQIHQIELEMQNEELHKSQAELETLLNQYTDLYDFAPVGYFTFDRDGAIRRVNLTGAVLLGKERARLVNSRFGQFVSEDDRPLFNHFLQEVFTKQDARSGKASCEVALGERRSRAPSREASGIGRAAEAGRRHVRIEGAATGDGRECRAVMTDVTERKRAEEKIQASLLEKETMLQEIHHRVKNNLQVISSLLDMQASRLQDEKAKRALQDSMDRVRAMAIIHSQLYQSQDLARVDFGLFIRDLIGNISQSSGRTNSFVDITVDAGAMRLDIESSIPCGLILSELVSNALKHAFPEGREGQIHIDMRSEENRVVLTVQDNGIGFPQSVDSMNVKSLGLQLVKILVGQINGNIAMEVDGGTTWTVAFPSKKDKEAAH